MKSPSEKKIALLKYLAKNDPEITKALNAKILPILNKFDPLLDRAQETLDKRLVRKLKDLGETYKKEILKIESKYRVILDPDREKGIPANEYYAIVMPAVTIVSNDDNFLTVRVDLRKDKKELRELIDDEISKAQKKTGNELTELQYRFFCCSLKRHYVENGLNKNDALEATASDMENETGIEIDPDTLNRRYFKRFKNDHGVKDLRELKRGDK